MYSSVMFPRRAATVLAAISAALLAIPVAAQVVPPLPRLDLDALPVAARAPLADAYKPALAKPDDAARVGALAQRLQAWEQWESAAAAYTRAAALAPRFEWFYLLGVVEARRGRHAEAAVALKAAVERRPAFLPARVRLADALFESGELPAAGQLYEALTREPAAEPHARYGLGRVQAARGDHAAAVREFTGAVRLYPEFGAAWYALGLSSRTLGLSAETRDALSRAQRYGALWPAIDDPVLGGVRALRDDAAAHLARGLSLERQGDLAGATREHEAAIAADPDLAQAHVNLVSLYGRQQEWSKAEAHYQQALRLKSGLAEAHYNYGVLLLLLKREAEAARAFQHAVEANPQYAAAWHNLGQLAERDRRWADAVAHYTRALEHSPTNRLTRFNLARMLIASGRPADAIAHFEVLAAADGAEQPRYMYGLATAYVLSGDMAKGRQRALDARALAASLGQQDLVAAIDRDLKRLPQ